MFGKTQWVWGNRHSHSFDVGVLSSAASLQSSLETPVKEKNAFPLAQWLILCEQILQIHESVCKDMFRPAFPLLHGIVLYLPYTVTNLDVYQ